MVVDLDSRRRRRCCVSCSRLLSVLLQVRLVVVVVRLATLSNVLHCESISVRSGLLHSLMCYTVSVSSMVRLATLSNVLHCD